VERDELPLCLTNRISLRKCGIVWQLSYLVRKYGILVAVNNYFSFKKLSENWTFLGNNFNMEVEEEPSGER
jgi:hypothetical protein